MLLQRILSSQHPHGSSQLQSGDLPSTGSFMHVVHIHTHTQVYTQKHLFKLHLFCGGRRHTCAVTVVWGSEDNLREPPSAMWILGIRLKPFNLEEVHLVSPCLKYLTMWPNWPLTHPLLPQFPGCCIPPCLIGKNFKVRFTSDLNLITTNIEDFNIHSFSPFLRSGSLSL